MASIRAVPYIHMLPAELLDKIFFEVYGGRNERQVIDVLRVVCRSWHKVVDEISWYRKKEYVFRRDHPTGLLKEYKAFANFHTHAIQHLRIQRGSLRDKEVQETDLLIPWSNLQSLHIEDRLAELSEGIDTCAAAEFFSVRLGEQSLHIRPGSPIASHVIVGVTLEVPLATCEFARFIRGATFLFQLRAAMVTFRFVDNLSILLDRDFSGLNTFIDRLLQARPFPCMKLKAQTTDDKNGLRDIFSLEMNTGSDEAPLANPSGDLNLALQHDMAYRFVTQSVPMSLQLRVTYLHLHGLPQDLTLLTKHQWPFLTGLSIDRCNCRKTIHITYLEDIMDFLDALSQSPPPKLRTVSIGYFRHRSPSGTLNQVRGELEMMWSESAFIRQESYFY